MPEIVARTLARSRSPGGVELVTFEVTAPKFLLAEINTHRMLSRSWASSRAIPSDRFLAAIETGGFVPSEFGVNRRGMQATETFSGEALIRIRAIWREALLSAVSFARELARERVHKQTANRIAEPYAYVPGVLTGTDWENFLALRAHSDAQPEFQELAEQIRDLLRRNELAAALAETHAAASARDVAELEWHRPYVENDEIPEIVAFTSDHLPEERLALVSSARAGRVSTRNHGTGKRDIGADLDLAADFRRKGHMGPFEHAATPFEADSRELVAFIQGSIAEFVAMGKPGRSSTSEFAERMARAVAYDGNFEGWHQFRKFIRGERVFRSAS